VPENALVTFFEKTFQWNILLLLGLALFGGTIGGKLFQKLRIPQVVGYIIIGIVFGEMFLGVISLEIVRILQPLSYMALGLIGFMIGGELKKEMFVKSGKQLLFILLFEGVFSFVLVTLFTSIVAFFIFKNWNLSISLGILLGAISSATAPAATTDVLWEYKTKGPLTRMVLGIVAMDDGLALLLFAVAASIAGVLMNNTGFKIASILQPVYEIIVSIVMGVLLGYFLSRTIKNQIEEDKILVFSLGLVLLNLGLSIALKLDMLLSSMAMGAMAVNYSPRKSKEIFNLTNKFTPPIYILFFVLVGAKLQIKHFSVPIFVLLLAYLFGRTAGKMFGSFLGARISKAARSIQKYLPLCLFSQAGVAIGLSILAGQKFSNDIADLIIIVITTTTFVVQLIGPPFVKIAVQKAHEVGLNINENDLLKKIRVASIMDSSIPLINETADLNKVLRIFSKNQYFYFPVIDDRKKLVGIISIDSIKEFFIEYELSSFLVAYDIMDRVPVTSSKNELAVELKNKMKKYDIEYMPVVSADNTMEGFVERRQIDKIISQKIMELHKKADTLG
jgi:Kef-type K+ transport system membrane component KefB/predicted transcriptional regulator